MNCRTVSLMMVGMLATAAVSVAIEPPTPLAHWNLDHVQDGSAAETDGGPPLQISNNGQVIEDERHGEVLQFEQGENDPAPNIAGETLGDVKKRTGCTIEDLKENGLTYDWAYIFMTDAQRNEVRTFIAMITRGKTFLGLDQVPAFPGNTSNWIIIHMNLLPLAKRGADFIGSDWSKNHVRRFQLGVMLPWGREFVYETGIGSPRDIATFKYAHLEDPVVDLIYAGAVLPLLQPDAQPMWTNIRTTYAPWWPQIVINDDPLGYDGNRYDFDAQFDTLMATLREQGEPLTTDNHGVRNRLKISYRIDL